MIPNSSRLFAKEKQDIQSLMPQLTQLKTENRMHGRARMIVASFLPKISLLIESEGRIFQTTSSRL
jgi:hypothetical protein